MNRRRTQDFDGAHDATRMRFFTVESLGASQHLTPEGFLLCLDVPIARTGTMLYGPGEVPVTLGPDGHIKIIRDEEEVFRPEHIASYAGKAVVDDHPDVDVNPENWRELAVGTALNPRRGTGMQGDLLIADLMITDPEAIKAVREGKREISCGYEADYEEVSPGLGRQTNLIGNHVALVDAGRCGSRCAIGDEKFSTGEIKMAKTNDKKQTWLDKLRRAFKNRDEEGFGEALEEIEGATGDEGSEGSEGGATHIHVGEPRRVTDDQLEEHMASNAQEHAEFRQRLEALEAQLATLQAGEQAEHGAGGTEAAAADAETEAELAEEAPAGTKDKAVKARDSAYMEESFQSTVAAAEILSPGIQIPTFDRAANPKSTLDSVCKLRRSALDKAYVSADGMAVVLQANGGKPLELSGMKCNAVRSLFNAAVAIKKASNNAGVRDHSASAAAAAAAASKKVGPQSLADLNQLNAQHWGGKA